MPPITLYCGPGPERMLSGIMAAASVAAEAGTDNAAVAVAATIKIVLLRMTDLLVMVDASTTPPAVARSRGATPVAEPRPQYGLSSRAPKFQTSFKFRFGR